MTGDAALLLGRPSPAFSLDSDTSNEDLRSGFSWDEYLRQRRLDDFRRLLLESIGEALGDPEVDHGRLLASVSNPTLTSVVRSLPLDLPMPEPVIGARGDIYLEWIRSPRWALVAVPQRSGELAYSALLGGDRRSACYAFRPGSSHDLFLSTLAEWQSGSAAA